MLSHIYKKEMIDALRDRKNDITHNLSADDYDAWTCLFL